MQSGNLSYAWCVCSVVREIFDAPSSSKEKARSQPGSLLLLPPYDSIGESPLASPFMEITDS